MPKWMISKNKRIVCLAEEVSPLEKKYTVFLIIVSFMDGCIFMVSYYSVVTLCLFITISSNLLFGSDTWTMVAHE